MLDGALIGLPLTVDAWNEAAELNASIVQSIEHRSMNFTDTHWQRNLAQFKERVEAGPPNSDDLQKLIGMQIAFFSSLGRMKNASVRAFSENTDPDAFRHIAVGIAAADGLPQLAELLNGGCEGEFICTKCARPLEYLVFDDRVVLYQGARVLMDVVQIDRKDRTLADYNDGAPNRADAVVRPLSANVSVTNVHERNLLDLATRQGANECLMLLKNFFGNFDCPGCGATARMCDQLGRH